MKLSETKIGIIGGGVVGRATARAFLEHVAEVRVYDKNKERSTHPLYGSSDAVLESDLIFICLPTPQLQNSLQCDTSILHSCFREIVANTYKDKVKDLCLVIRSTVPIGFTREVAKQYGLKNLVHSPEFLTARCSMVDAQIPSRNIIGVPGGIDKPETAIQSFNCLEMIETIYQLRFPNIPLMVMNSDESEAVKLFQNGFFAVKVAYFNEVHALAQKLNLNWEGILGSVLVDGRIHSSHTKVPGPDGKFGFGGTCLPKDLANLIVCMQDNQVEQFIALAAHNRNITIDRDKD